MLGARHRTESDKADAPGGDRVCHGSSLWSSQRVPVVWLLPDGVYETRARGLAVQEVGEQKDGAEEDGSGGER